MKFLVWFFVLILLFTMVLSGCGNNPTPRINEVEPNNDFGTAQSIPVNGTIINASIGAAGDKDIYKFTAVVGYGYRVQLTWVSGNNFDLVGDWYDESFNHLKNQDSLGVRCDETDTIDFHTVGGVCYLKISCYDDLYTGEYKISVTKGGYDTP